MPQICCHYREMEKPTCGNWEIGSKPQDSTARWPRLSEDWPPANRAEAEYMILDWFFSLGSRKHLQLPEPKIRLRNTSHSQALRRLKKMSSHKRRGVTKVPQTLSPTTGRTEAQVRPVCSPRLGSFHLKQESWEEQTRKALSVSGLTGQPVSKRRSSHSQRTIRKRSQRGPSLRVSVASPRLCVLLNCFCHPTSHP